ncbi:MAG: Rne/Rng family ribonuclease [Candidatus Omnitrophota bacterium]|nr:Rne/Rng family ribonuclease [Candidatus Omnitrophota bacterium]
MSKDILINIKPKEKRVAVVKEGKLEEFYLELSGDTSLLGNIYKGRIDSVVPSINAAFVDIGIGKNGFLYLTEMSNPLLEEETSLTQKFLNKILKKKTNVATGRLRFVKGDEVLVQVVKEPFGTKGPRLTTHISLAGRFLVLMSQDKPAGVSRRIDSLDERRRLRQILSDLRFAEGVGFIVRTASLGKGKRELIRDAKFLFKMWLRIKSSAKNQKAPALIYKEYDLMWRVVRDYFSEDIDGIYIDSKLEFLKFLRFVKTLIGPHLIKKIHFYKENLPLFEAKGIENEIKKIYERKIFLKSGAYIVIEPTEGLTVVDVNSGKFKSQLDPETAAFQVNIEVASEIARQIRLRDIGGIIVIDFIDMAKESHRKAVFETLKQALSFDRAKTEVQGISNLGLVEMTRERTGKTLESKSFEDCPHCKGTGKIKINEDITYGVRH